LYIQVLQLNTLNRLRTGVFNNAGILNMSKFQSTAALGNTTAISVHQKINKSVFGNKLLYCNCVTILHKNFTTKTKVKKFYKMLYKFFKKLPNNRFVKQKSTKFLSHLLVYFFITHDLHFFVYKLSIFLQNTSRRLQFKLVRYFVLLNQSRFSNMFSFFKVSGLYFKVSGKFGGAGGSKKLKKKIVWFKPRFSDRSLKIQRSINTVWSFSGVTTWSVYATYLK